MRKIKRISQLEYEQEQLHRRETELKKKIRNDVRSVRRSWRISGIVGRALSSWKSWIGRKLSS